MTQQPSNRRLFLSQIVTPAGRLFRRAATAPAAPSTAGSSSTVLDTVAEDGTLLCACGCGALIDDRSQSMYYATEVCQRRWNLDQATDPGEVLSAPVDADVLVERDARELGQSADDTAMEILDRFQFARRNAAITADGSRWIIPSDLHHLAYRRECRTCGPVPPLVEFDAGRAPNWTHRTDPAAIPGLFSKCAVCGTDLHGPAFVGTIVEYDDRMVFVLEAGHSSMSRTFRPVAPHDLTDPVVVARAGRAWERMQQALTTWSRSWTGQNTTFVLSPGTPPPYIDEVASWGTEDWAATVRLALMSNPGPAAPPRWFPDSQA